MRFEKRNFMLSWEFMSADSAHLYINPFIPGYLLGKCCLDLGIYGIFGKVFGDQV